MSDNSKTSEQPKPLVECDLGENGGKVALYTKDEIKEWVETELRYWDWALSKSGAAADRLKDRWQNALEFFRTRAH